jgi:hypothetical protein
LKVFALFVKCFIYIDFLIITMYIIWNIYFKNLYELLMSQIKEIATWLERTESILLVGGSTWTIDDACGEIALYYALTKAGKKVTALSPDSVPENIEFLPNTKSIGRTLAAENEFVLSIATGENEIVDMRQRVTDGRVDIIVVGKDRPFRASDVSFKKTSQSFDAIVTLGLDSLDQAGQIFSTHPELFSSTPIINLSVSLKNEYFGRFNVVDPSKSSVSEMVADLIQSSDTFSEHLDSTLATTLLTGVLSATDSFLSPLTTANSLRLASTLQTAGADQPQIIEHLFKEKTYKNLKVLGQILTNLELSDSHKIAWSYVTQSQFENLNSGPGDIDHWAEQILRHTNETDFFLLLLETEEGIKVLIRAGQDHASFNDLSTLFSGESEHLSKGLNLVFAGKNMNDTLSEMIDGMTKYQAKRLRLPEDTPLHLMKIEHHEVTQQNLLEKLQSKKSASDKAFSPETIPFAIGI